MKASVNPFDNLCKTLNFDGQDYRYYDLTALNDARYDSLPFSIRVLLESAVRCCDQFHVRSADVHNILDWCRVTGDQATAVEVPFKPARVILQDFTGVPAVVDFAAMRDAVQHLGGDPQKINPVCPSDLVIDHSVQVDYTRAASQHLPRVPDSCSASQSVSATGDASNWRRDRSLRSSQPSSCSGDIEGSVWSPSDPNRRRLQARVRRQPLTGPSITTPASSPVAHTPAASNTLPNRPYAPSASATSSNAPHTPSTSARVCNQKIAITRSPNLSAQHSRSSASSLTAASVYIPPYRRAAAVSSSATGDSTIGREDVVVSLSTRGATLPGCPRASSGRCACIGLTVPACDVPAAPIKHQICPFHELQSAFADALKMNQELEFERNRERFQFLKWGSQSFSNMLIVPPGSGIVHQVNLEYLARLVFVSPDPVTSSSCQLRPTPLLYPDSLVGTDSHTTMINGLGVVGWGVGGIEAEAVMLGQTVSMVLPAVVGYRIHGRVNPLATSTDVVLTITKHLRQVGVVGKFVEFFGPGVSHLSIADRATISNMCPEYGATVGFFPVDHRSVEYLRQTGRDERRIALIEAYLRAVRMFRDFERADQDPVFSQVVELDLSTVVPSLSGPKRPHDRVAVADMRMDFMQCLSNPVGFKGYGLASDRLSDSVEIEFDGKSYRLHHGSVVIAAITSCTNTSNPSVMLGAGVLARNAVRRGLTVAPWIKTSLSPGSGVVTHYLQQSGVMPDLRRLGFDIVGYGCMTCIGNSGPLPDPVVQAIEQSDLVCCGVLSGNRNFEGRIHPHVRANYLASPLLVVAYAIAGRVDIDFEKTPLGTGAEGDIYLRDIWPSRDEIQALEVQSVIPVMFKDVYSKITKGNESWNELVTPNSVLYPWSSESTYIKRPPFFENMTMELPPPVQIRDARVLVFLGDSVTTDHISPAGSIARNSPAARYLAQHGLTPRQFNSYGSRRGNDAVMSRGTFANVRLVNMLLESAGNSLGPRTVHVPSGQVMDVFDAAERYRCDATPTIVLAGKDYGCGSSRDWAAKGPFLLGVRAVLAESYERIHRSNLVGMGLVPLQFCAGQTAATLGLTGRETFSILLPEKLQPGMLVPITTGDGKQFDVVLRFDTEVELQYHRHGGILNYMIRKMIADN